MRNSCVYGKTNRQAVPPPVVFELDCPTDVDLSGFAAVAFLNLIETWFDFFFGSVRVDLSDAALLDLSMSTVHRMKWWSGLGETIRVGADPEKNSKSAICFAQGWSGPASTR
jgi:hypothetical protein